MIKNTPWGKNIQTCIFCASPGFFIQKTKTCWIQRWKDVKIIWKTTIKTQNSTCRPKIRNKVQKRLFWYGQASPLGWHPVKRLKGNAFVKWVRTRARHPLAWTKYWLYKQIKISFVPQRPTPIPFSVHHQHDHQIYLITCSEHFHKAFQLFELFLLEN